MKIVDLIQDTAFKDSHVAMEIKGQPELWRNTYNAVVDKQNELQFFFDKILKTKNLQIILSGAGSSAFIGEILQQSFYCNTGITTIAVPTTDLVTHPNGYFKKSTPILLISFARSGDSPESVATFELAEKFHDIIYHLIITCNPEGSLAKKAYRSPNCYVFVLPAKANDQALAMTGSFTSMSLAGLLISDIYNIDKNGDVIDKLIKCGNSILEEFSLKLKKVAVTDFKRAIFLGSGALKGAAKECHLKLLEMTDGQIICQYDSFLGFRHGPRAAIDKSTLLVYLFSSDPYVYKYEADLVQSISQSEHFLYSIGIGQGLQKLGNLNIGLAIDLNREDNKIPDDFFSICGVVPSQLIAFYKSIVLGLMPDSPSKNGGINRVVQGVTIYPY